MVQDKISTIKWLYFKFQLQISSCRNNIDVIFGQYDFMILSYSIIGSESETEFP